MTNPAPIAKSAMTSHDYLSTACLHDKHSECRLACKFCPAACACDCGHPGAKCAQCGHPRKWHGPPCAGDMLACGCMTFATRGDQ